MAKSKKTVKAFNAAVNIQISDFMGQSLHIVDVRDPRSVALLTKGYEDVYKPAFPIDDEREPLEKWLKILKKPGQHIHLIALVVGKDLDTPNPVIKGVATTEYYPQFDVGQLAYVATSPNFRNEGLGRVMVEARKKALLDAAKKNGGTLKGVFIGCNDPAKVKPEEDSFDPTTRINIFQKWGAKIMPIDFVLPPLTKDTAKCDKFKILAYPHPETGNYPTADGLRSFINGIYTSLAAYSPMPPAQNPDYLNMMRQIDQLPAGKPIHPSNDNNAPQKPGF